MSAPEHVEEVGQRSRVKVVLNARGSVQWEISVLAGESHEVIEQARDLAVQMHRAMEGEFGLRASEAA